MSNLTFALRGPFKITGEGFLSWNYNLLTYCSWCTFQETKIRERPKWQQAMWYRKPSLADRGPFYFHSRVVTVFTLPKVSPFALFFPGDRSKGLGVCAWIYYSRNISTATTCY
jgi:hypothetical protein